MATCAGALTVKCVAAPALTVMVAAPLIVAVTESVAVSVRLPVVFSVTLNAPMPFVSVTGPGVPAAGSLLVNTTVPAWPLAVLLSASTRRHSEIESHAGRDSRRLAYRKVGCGAWTDADGATSAIYERVGCVGGDDPLITSRFQRDTIIERAVAQSPIGRHTAWPSVLVKRTVPE